MTIRLAALDLDGTVLRTDYGLSPRTADALASARAAGIEVVYVTVRHEAAIRHYPGLGDSGVAVCCIGAAVCDLADGAVRWSRPIPAEAAVRVADRCRTGFPGAHLGWVLADGRIGHQDGYPLTPLIGDAFFGDPAAIEAPVLRMWLVGPGLDAAAVGRSLAGLVDVGHSGSGVADLVAPGVTKLGTLRRLCEERGIAPEEVIAFGDSAADLPMIRWAGHGVLMGNADPALRPDADEIAPHCDDDGVAEVLERVVRKGGVDA